MSYRLKWSGDGENERDVCGSVSELIGTVGLFYIALICLGLIFVQLGMQRSEANFAQTQTPESGLLRALLPFDSGN